MARPRHNPKSSSGGGGGRRRADPSEATYEEVVVKVNRCAKVMKGGRRFSFSALVVVGNRGGRVGTGFGKARGVPGAVEKGVKDAKKSLFQVPMDGTTITHPIDGLFESTKVRLIPAAPGTGVVAGAAVRAVLEMAGVKDVLTKVYGSKNALNVVRATVCGLQELRSKQEVASLRGVSIA